MTPTESLTSEDYCTLSVAPSNWGWDPNCCGCSTAEINEEVKSMDEVEPAIYMSGSSAEAGCLGLRTSIGQKTDVSEERAPTWGAHSGPPRRPHTRNSRGTHSGRALEAHTHTLRARPLWARTLRARARGAHHRSTDLRHTLGPLWLEPAETPPASVSATQSAGWVQFRRSPSLERGVSSPGSASASAWSASPTLCPESLPRAHAPNASPKCIPQYFV